MKKYISPLSLLLISLSSMIGSGWLFGSLYSAHLAGPAAILTWPLAAFLLFFVALSYAEIGAMFPHADNLTILPLRTHGRLASVILSGLGWLSLATIPVIETQGLIQYASNYLPGLMTQVGTHYVSTPSGYLCAIGLLFTFVIFNYFGVRFFSHINAGFTIWKLIIPALTVIVLFSMSYHPHDLTQYGGFMPYGWKGVLAAMSSGGALFSFLGFRQIVIMMGAVRNPGKYVPLLLIGSLAITALLYTGLQWSFIGTISKHDLAHGWANLVYKGDAGPFAALAAMAGLIWLSLLLYVDAFISPYATGLVFSTSAAHLLASMSKVDDVPEIFSKKNKHQSPWVSLGFNFILAMAMFLILRDWQAMAAFIVSVQITSYMVGPVCLVCLRKQMPNTKRPFKLHFSGLISFIGFFVCTTGAYWCGWSSILKLLILTGSGTLFYIFYHVILKKSKEDMQLKNSIWLIAYLCGLGVFSYFGNYGGGTNQIPLYWDLLYLMAFSLIIFVAAIYSRSRVA